MRSHLLTFITAFSLTALLTGNLPAQLVIAYRNANIETATDAGTMKGATILVHDGKIEAVGTDIEIPIAAQTVNLDGKWVMPGFVDPYYVVPVGSDRPAVEEREVTFGGRTFRVPQSPAATPTSFVRIVDGFDPRGASWGTAVRCGITSAQLVAEGFGESSVAKLNLENPGNVMLPGQGQLFLALTNQTSSLDVLRKGLADPNSSRSGRPSPSAPPDSSSRSRGGFPRGGRIGPSPSPGGGPSAAPAAAASSSPSPPRSPADELWQQVREGKKPLLVNVNNAASILYLTKEIESAKDTKLVLVAGGDDLYLTNESLDKDRVTVVMPPRIDLIPNTRDRVNVARMLTEKGYRIAFSLSLNQGDFQRSQDSPLFAVAMLVRSGLDRQTAVKALTRLPAEIVGIQNEVGTIEKGKQGNFLVLDEDPFSATANIVQVIVEGRPVYEQ